MSARIMNVAWKKMLEAPANLGSQVVAWPPVAVRLETSYEIAKRAHEAHLPALRHSDARIVKDLVTSGVSVTSLEAMGLEGVDAMLADAYALVARHSPWTRSFQADGADIVAHDKIIRWGLNERLLDIAENYLCLPVGYDGINVFFTKADGIEGGARRWHRDAEDRRMVKIALYLNDVDEDGGPLQVLRRRLPDHDRLVRGKFPILRQGQLEQALGDFEPDRDVVTCTGKAGTLVFADTAALYHRGKPARARNRARSTSTICPGRRCGHFGASEVRFHGRRSGAWLRPCHGVSATACFGATPSHSSRGSSRPRRSGSRITATGRPPEPRPVTAISHDKRRLPRRC